MSNKTQSLLSQSGVHKVPQIRHKVFIVRSCASYVEGVPTKNEAHSPNPPTPRTDTVLIVDRGPTGGCRKTGTEKRALQEAQAFAVLVTTQIARSDHCNTRSLWILWSVQVTKRMHLCGVQYVSFSELCIDTLGSSDNVKWSKDNCEETVPLNATLSAMMLNPSTQDILVKA